MQRTWWSNHDRSCSVGRQIDRRPRKVFSSSATSPTLYSYQALHPESGLVRQAGGKKMLHNDVQSCQYLFSVMMAGLGSQGW